MIVNGLIKVWLFLGGRQKNMDAHKMKYLEMRLKGLSHAAAFALVQSLLGPLSPAQRRALLNWIQARETQIDRKAAKSPVTASPIS